MNWEDAKAWINALNNIGFAGYDDWRLPNVKELMSIVDYSTINPTADAILFSPGWWGGGYTWTSTPIAFYSYCNCRWVVGFSAGEVIIWNALEALYVRAVRGGQ